MVPLPDLSTLDAAHMEALLVAAFEQIERLEQRIVELVPSVARETVRQALKKHHQTLAP